MRPPERSLIGPRGRCSCWVPFFPRRRLGGAGGPKLALRSRPPGPPIEPGGPPGRGPPKPPPPPPLNPPPGRGLLKPPPPPPGRGLLKPPPGRGGGRSSRA